MSTMSASLEPSRIRRGTLGAIEGALALGLIGGLAGAAAGSLAPRGLLIGVVAGVWLGAVAGCFRSMRGVGSADASALAYANGVVLAAVVGAVYWLHASGLIDVGGGLAQDVGPTSDDMAIGLGILLGSLPVVATSTVIARWIVRTIPDRLARASARAKVVVPVSVIAAVVPLMTFVQGLELRGPDGMTRLEYQQWTTSATAREMVADRTEDLARYAMTATHAGGLQRALEEGDTAAAGAVLRSVVPDDGVPGYSVMFFELDLLALVDAEGKGVAEYGTAAFNAENTWTPVDRTSKVESGTSWSFAELDTVLSGETDLTVVGVTKMPQQALVAVSPLGDGALVAAIRLERLAEWISFRTMSSVAFYDGDRNRVSAQQEAWFPERMPSGGDSMMSSVVREDADGVRVATSTFPLMMLRAAIPADSMGEQQAKQVNARGWGAIHDPSKGQPLVGVAFDAGPWTTPLRSWVIKMSVAFGVALAAIGGAFLVTRRRDVVSDRRDS